MNHPALMAAANTRTGVAASDMASTNKQGAARRPGQIFVLVHGACHGGWCWRHVADRLRASGHRVFTPTCTGLGERAHLMSREITLDTFTQDIAGVIEAEELGDIVLVGHSFGGLPVSGVADIIPDRIRHLVFLDALLAQPGRSAFDGLPPEIVAARRKAAEETSGGLSFSAPPPSVFGVTRGGRRGVGRAPPHAAAARDLHEPAQHPERARQRVAPHLHCLHQPSLHRAGRH